VLEHASTSRLHAAFYLDARKQPFVVDLGSAHGTYVATDVADPKRLRPFEPEPASTEAAFRFGLSSRWFRLAHLETSLRRAKRDRLYERIASSSSSSSALRLKIANVSYDASADDLRTDVLDGVTVTALALPTATKSRHAGFAVVDLATERDLLQVLACDGDELKGRRIRVKRVDDGDPEVARALQWLRESKSTVGTTRRGGETTDRDEHRRVTFKEEECAT